MSNGLNALRIAHHFIQQYIQPGDFYIDGTAGRGRDTAFLCEKVGEEGKVLAFDIQQEALDSTRELLEEKQLLSRAQLILDSHHRMDAYAQPGTVDGMVFNFGWLPGGDHTIQTQPESSIEAIEKGLDLLRVGGIMSLCIYYGGDSGFAERDALLEFLPTLNPHLYTVLVTQFVGRPNNPPIPVCIVKDRERES